MQNPVMYTFLNKGLNMTLGKAAAQAQHAAVLAYAGSSQEAIDAWMSGGHYAKVVFQAKNEHQLMKAQRYIEDRGFKTFLIIDEGRTEIDPHSVTALGVEIVDKADRHVADTFSSFQVFRDTVRVTVDIDR